MNKEINEHVVKLTGKANIPKELELGHNYKLVIDGEITAITESNNDDGTFDRYYKFVPILVKIELDNGETIKARDNRKNSQKIRNMLYKWYENTPTDGRDFDTVYEMFTKQILLDMEDLYEKSRT